MKQNLFFALTMVMAIGLFSCDGDEPNNAPEQKLDIDVPQLTFEAKSPVPQIITVTSENVEWIASVNTESAEWLKIETKENKITATATECTQYTDRYGEITITPTTDKIKPKVVKVTQKAAEKVYDIRMSTALLAFHGDAYSAGYSNYTLELGTEGAEITQTYTGEELLSVADGTILIFDIITTKTNKEDYRTDIRLKEGTYTESMGFHDPGFEHKPMTYVKSYHDKEYNSYKFSMIYKYEDKSIVDYIMIQEGDMNVKIDGDTYTITFDLILGDGSPLSIIYEGAMTKINNYGYFSTYTKDYELDMNKTNSGELYYDADMYKNNTYSWTVYMRTEGLEVDESNNYSGSGYELMILDIYSTQTSTTILPDGKYTLDDSQNANTILPGVQVMLLYRNGAWLTEYKDGKIVNKAPLSTGNITFKHLGDDKYSIDIDAVSDNYYTVKVKGEGNLKYIDNTEEEW